MKNKTGYQMILIVIILLITFLSNSIFSQSQPKAWYVYKNATGNNDGTSWTNAWTSPTQINWNVVQPRDTIYISGGTDSLVYVFNGIPIRVDSITITKGKSPGHNGRVILKSTAPNTNRGFYFYNHPIKAVAITDLEFQDWHIAITISGEGDSIKVQNCRSINSRSFFIMVYGVSNDTTGKLRNVYILNNYIETAVTGTEKPEGVEDQTDGIQASWVMNLFVIGNTMVNKNQRVYDSHTDYVQAGKIRNAYIINNFFIHANTLGWGQNGASVSDWVQGDIYYVNNIIVQGNYTNNYPIWNNPSALYTYVNPKVRILHNTLIAGHHGMIQHGVGSDVMVKNNIFYATGTYSGSNFGRFYFILIRKLPDGTYPIPASNFDVKYNSFYAWFDTTSIKYLSPGLDGDPPPRHPSNGYYYPMYSGAQFKPSFVNFPNFTSPTITYTPETFPYSTNPQDYRLTSASVREIGTAEVLQESDFPTDPLAPSWFKIWNYIKKDFNGVDRGASWDRGAFEVESNLPIGDNTPPEVLSANIIDSVSVNLTFSEPVEQSTATNPTNYSIDNGISVNSVQLLNSSVVKLNTSLHNPGFYTVIVNNVTDTAGNVINPANNSAMYGYNPDPLPGLLKIIPTGTNASSIPEPEHLPEKTFDGLGYNSGDPSSRWAGTNLPQWIGYDLGDSKILNKIRIQFYKWNEGRIYNYSIMSSLDSVNWTYIKQNIYSTNTEWTEVTFEPVPARYVRVVVHSNNQNNWASLWETEFYGQLILSNDDQSNVPENFVLEQNYPNPFNPTTKIRYSIPQNSDKKYKVSLQVYDLLGNEIAVLVNEEKEAGVYEVEFNASDLSSGIYIYRLRTEYFTNSKKMILLR